MLRALACVVITIVATGAYGDVIYVNDDAAGANDGSSWTDACTELQSALAVAETGDEIWVAAGTYRPDFNVATGQHAGDRDATFRLKSGVALYGGFVGTESDLNQRTPTLSESILSGDLNRDDEPGCSLICGTRRRGGENPAVPRCIRCALTDNARHVVTGT